MTADADIDYPFPDHFLAGMYLEFLCIHGHEVESTEHFCGVPERYLHRRLFPDEPFEKCKRAMNFGRSASIIVARATNYISLPIDDMHKADVMMMAAFEIAASVMGLRFKLRSPVLLDKDGAPVAAFIRRDRPHLRPESLFVGAKVRIIEDARPFMSDLPEGDYSVPGEVVELPDGHIHVRWPHMSKDDYACVPPVVLVMDESSLN